MTKQLLIQIIRDSLVSGNQKEAEDAIDEYVKEKSTDLLFLMWQLDIAPSKSQTECKFIDSKGEHVASSPNVMYDFFLLNKPL